MIHERPLEELIGEPSNFDVPAPESFLMEHMTTLTLAEYRRIGTEVRYDNPYKDQRGKSDELDKFSNIVIGGSLNILAEMARIGHIIRTHQGMKAISDAERLKYGNGSGVMFVTEPELSGFSWTPHMRVGDKSKARPPIENLVVESLEDLLHGTHEIIRAQKPHSKYAPEQKRWLRSVQAKYGKAVTPSAVKIWTGIAQVSFGGSNVVENLDI